MEKIFFSIIKDTFPCDRIPGWQFTVPKTVKLFYCFMVCIVSDRDYICLCSSVQNESFFFPSGFFEDFSLFLVFRNFIMKYLGVDFFLLILLGIYGASWDSKVINFNKFVKANYILFYIIFVREGTFLPHFFFLSVSFWLIYTAISLNSLEYLNALNPIKYIAAFIYCIFYY